MIFIIGTVHNDFTGSKKLSHVLQSLQPTLIGIEGNEEQFTRISNCSANMRDELLQSAKSIEARMLNELKLTPEEFRFCIQFTQKSIENQLFECKTARQYIELHPGTQLEFIDMDLDLSFYEIQMLISMQLGPLQVLFSDDPMVKDNPFVANTKAMYIDFLRNAIRNPHFLESASAQAYCIRDNIRLYLRQLNQSMASLPGEIRRVFLKINSPRRNRYMAKRISDLYRKGGTQIYIVGLAHLDRIKNLLNRYKPAVYTLLEANSLLS